MPQVDYEERRRKIAEITADVIAHEGVDAATVRRIASQAQSSTTFITNYFADKRELLLSAYRLISVDALARFEQKTLQGPADILESLVSLTAIDDDNWRGWRVYIAFWEKAIRDPVLASEQQYWVANSRLYVEQALEAGYGRGGDIEGAARLVIALIHGISIQVMFDKTSWSRESIRSALARQLELVLGRR